MTTGQWIILDHVGALASITAWFAAGVTLALRRARLARAALVTAVLVTLVRVVTVAVLAGRGWWFVQEKVLLGLPMLGVAAVAAVLIAARRGHGEERPASSVVWTLTAGYAALAGLVVTFLVGYPLTWSTALITISLVSAAALLTARVLAAPGESTADGGTSRVGAGITRRRFIGWAGGAVVVSTAGVGAGLSFMPSEPVITGDGPGRSSRAVVSVAECGDMCSPRGRRPHGSRPDA
jgi:hypothetical protein